MEEGTDYIGNSLIRLSFYIVKVVVSFLIVLSFYV